jgi:hypothetical protein
MADETDLDERVELAMRRANVPIDTRLGATFARSYQGERGWDPDTLRRAYDDLASEVGGQPPSDDGDREMAREREAIQQGAMGDTGSQTSVGRRRAIVAEGIADLEGGSGKTREDIAGEVFGKLAALAAETGEGVIPE